MSLTVNRFEVISAGGKNEGHFVIKDHSTDSLVVLVKMFDDEELNKSLAEDFIPVIEAKVTENESNE